MPNHIEYEIHQTAACLSKGVKISHSGVDQNDLLFLQWSHSESQQIHYSIYTKNHITASESTIRQIRKKTTTSKTKVFTSQSYSHVKDIQQH